MSSVQIRDVRKSFGNFEVLHGVTVPIEDGQFVVLVGPSGCGKSTLLRMLAGLENITSGTISIGDRVVNNVQPKERDIAMVFQNYALYPHMTVADNMGFSLKLRDAKLRVAMRTEIKELHQRLRTTTVYVTHDQIEAMTMADKIVVMHDGVVEQMGTPLELYDRPENKFVAGFIGSPAMNFLEGTLKVNGGQPWVETANGAKLPITAAPAAANDKSVTYGI